MSTTPERTPGTSELEQLSARLDELQRRTEGLTAALKRSRSTRRLIMFAFLAFVVLAVMRFYSLGNRIQSADYQNRLIAELRKSVDSNQDVFAGEAHKLVASVTPVVQSAFSEQVAKDMPLFMQVIDQQRTTLIDNLTEQMTKKLEGHHHELLRRHEKLFQEEFPSVQNPETRARMMGNTQLAMDRLVKKYYVDEFKKELQTMEKTWEDFPVADKPAKGEPSLEDQLKGALMDMVAITLARSRPSVSK